ASRFLHQTGKRLAPVAENAAADPQRLRAMLCLRAWRSQKLRAAKSPFAWQSQGRGASARAEKSIRNNCCTARKDVPGGSPENIRSRFHCWEFARQSQAREPGCGDNRRVR